MGVSETNCATLAALRQNKLIQGNVKLYAAMWACLPQSRLIWRDAGLSGEDARLSTANQPYPGQNKVIQAKTRLSGGNQPYPKQNKAIRRKVK
jgi:hypothetical protein